MLLYKSGGGGVLFCPVFRKKTTRKEKSFFLDSKINALHIEWKNEKNDLYKYFPKTGQKDTPSTPHPIWTQHH